MRIMPAFQLAILSCLVLHAAMAGAAVFDADPQHPWNRLHRALYARAMPDGNTYDQESLEPPFIPSSKFLIEGASHDQALAALDDFLKDGADARITDPLKRAVLQRDLWAVFTMLTDPKRSHQPQRRELQKRLAQVMRRIALSAKEIEALPDNLAAAIEAETFAKAYDPQHPDHLLPPDLLDKDGPWAILGNRLRHDRLAAPSHANFTNGRSDFQILLRLPAGRQATKDYLNELQIAKVAPQIPLGTHVALLRRTLLVDNSGILRPAPLVENLQIRVYRQLTPPDVYEFTLNRQALFAGRNGGLRAIDAEKTAYYGLPFGIVPDPRRAGDPISDPLESKKLRPANVVLKSCIGCHAGPGIWSFQSLVEDHFDTYPLCVSDEARQTQHTLDSSQKSYAWDLLQDLWKTDAR